MIRRVTHALLVGLIGLTILAAGTAFTGPTSSAAAATKVSATGETQPPRPELRAGINEQQLQHAITIVEAGQDLGLSRQAFVVAIATAMQESQLEVLANVHVPNSFDYEPRDGYGRDHDSVGIFQQRVRYYCVNDLQYCMDPRYSAMKFYNDLERVGGWEDLPVTVAAQRVQGSAFPDHYAKHQGAAELIVDSILDWQDA